MKQKLVSVIVPTYNRKKLLKRSIGSLLKQSYKNLEIILIDDGSTDGTKDLIKNIKDKRIKYFYTENSGPTNARNIGLKKATGDYICFLDDDDIYLKSKVESNVEYLETYKNLGFCYSNLFVEFNKKQRSRSHATRVVWMRKRYKNSYLNLLMDTTGSFINTPTVFLRRKIINKVGLFNDKYEPAEDYDYWLRCAKIADFGYIDIPLATFKIHSGNITRLPSYLLTGLSLVKFDHLKKLKNKQIPKNYLNKYHFQIYYHKGRILFFKGNKGKARALFLKAVLKNPLNIPNFVFIADTFFQKNYLTNFTYKINDRLKKI